MLSISHALERLKSNLTDVVPQTLVQRLCADLHRPHRQRCLTPVVTTYLFLRQVLHGNAAVGTLRPLSGLDFTDSAYCQARARLPVGYFHRLQRAVTGRCASGDDAASRWHGHRLFLLDGSSFSMPDTPELQESFGQSGTQAKGCGFPTAHLLVLFDAHAGYLLKAVPAPLRTHDLAHAAVMHHELQPGDVLVGDRAFCSYAHLALCRQRRLHAVFRAHQPAAAGSSTFGRTAAMSTRSAPPRRRPGCRVRAGSSGWARTTNGWSISNPPSGRPG